MRRRLASLLIVAVAVSLTTVALAASPSPVQAGQSSFSVEITCGFANPPAHNPGSAFASSMVVVAPDSVLPGEAFAVTIDANPMVNGPVAIVEADAAEISAIATVAGDAAAPGIKESAPWKNPTPIEANAQYDISPRTINVTAGAAGSVTVAFDKFRLFVPALNTSLYCAAYAPGGAQSAQVSVTVPIGGGDTTTTTSGDTTTTTAGDTTTTTVAGDTTTTTVEDTTTTTIVEDTTTTTVGETTTTTIPSADYRSAAQKVSYGCQVTVSGSDLGIETATQTITLTAPDRVNPGDSFSVTIKMSPGPESGPVPLAAGTQLPSAKISASGGASPATATAKGSAIPSAISPNSIIPIPAMSAKFTATGSAGDTITFSPGTFVIDSPSLDARTTCRANSTPGIITTAIVSEPVQVDDGSLPNTGISDYTAPLGLAVLALYVGGLFISTLPRKHSDSPVNGADV